MLIGIDIGGSTTKIIGFKNKTLTEPMVVKASDPVASASGALGKFLTTTHTPLQDVTKLMVTGVGSDFLPDNLLGLPLTRVQEFQAVGFGGLYLSGLQKAVIVSMGTGTALIKANQRCIAHLGGTGVGGGTITGLSKALINISDFKTIIEMASEGILDNVDLKIQDISPAEIGILSADITASNFGKMNDSASRNDICLGILNLVFQTVGMMSIFAARNENDKDIVLTGHLANIPQARVVFKRLADLFKVEFHFPAHAEYATAIGAAILFAIDDYLPLPA